VPVAVVGYLNVMQRTRPPQHFRGYDSPVAAWPKDEVTASLPPYWLAAVPRPSTDVVALVRFAPIKSEDLRPGVVAAERVDLDCVDFGRGPLG